MDYDAVKGSLEAAASPGGLVTLFGHDVAMLDKDSLSALRRRIGIVFQDFRLLDHMTTYENVSLPFRIAGRVGAKERDRIAAALRAVGLAGFEGAYPHQLSGGMRMRVSIARALVTDPDLLLLDEPFAALDEITRMALNDDLLRLWEGRRTTMVFVTHSVFESVYLSTRIAVMTARPGHIVADLRVDLPQPRHRALRTSPDYAALCATVSKELARAMSDESPGEPPSR